MENKYYSKENLERIKNNISKSYSYFKDNYTRFYKFRKFVFDTSINDNQKAHLGSTQMPLIEFNILESYISRLLGEFSKHEPSIDVMPSEGNPVPPEVIEIVQGYIRHILYEANKNSCSYDVYRDSLTGGFSVVKVWTDYESPMSFKQIIKMSRVFDPTMTVFDPMSRLSHKADGNFSGELFPMTEDDFKRDYPNSKVGNFYNNAILEEFMWAYKNDLGEKIILIADYYEKKKKRTKILQLSNGRVITEKNYKKLQKYWEYNQFIEQIPVVVGEPRWSDLEIICCYKLSCYEILEYEETDYIYLPHVFIDGNSIILQQGTSNVTYQMTRPYIYHAKGVQNLKNYAGQCLANYLESMIKTKFIVMKEAIPQEEDYIDALTETQKANTIVVNAFCENNPSQQIPTPIREVVNAPAPPEIMGAFQVTDPTTQAILGSYASNLGKNDNDLSGKAVIESASVGNAAAMPYVTSYLAGLTQIATIIVDLIPKYIKGKREIPVVNINGKKDYKSVNEKGSPYLDYEENSLKVNIEAGVNFQVQKNQALQQISILMGVSKEFNDFMNSDVGLPILVKNLTVYGADELQEAVPIYLEQQKQQQQKAQQIQMQAMQADPRMIKAQAEVQKIQMQAQENQMKQENDEIRNQIDIAKVAIDKELADSKIFESEAKISQEQINSAVRLEESQTSLETHALDKAAKLAEIRSREHERTKHD